MLRIDAIRFGLAGGILVSGLIFVLTLVSAATGFALEYMSLLKSIFIGYEVGVFGSLIGAVYGFISGFFELFLLAFIYNLLGPSSHD